MNDKSLKGYYIMKLSFEYSKKEIHNDINTTILKKFPKSL